MAYNPYAISSSYLEGLQAEAAKKTKGEAADVAVGTQKEKMIKEYEADLEAAHEKAQAELRRKRKKKKGLGWLGTLVSFINPIAGAVIGGFTAASEERDEGRHGLSKAKLARAYAKDIDQERWGGTFLGKDASRYLKETSDIYDAQVETARDIKEKTGSLEGMGLTALLSGVTSWGTGEAMKGGVYKIKAAKDVKALELDKLSSDVGIKPGQIQPIGPEGMPIDMGTGKAVKASPKFIKSLSEKHNITEEEATKLAEAKHPQAKALLLSAVEAGKKLKDPGELFSSLDESGSIDLLTALLGIIQDAKTNVNIKE